MMMFLQILEMLVGRDVPCVESALEGFGMTSSIEKSITFTL